MSRPKDYEQIIIKLSRESFTPYLKHKNFYPFLHILEISLRNSINDLFIKEFGESWFDPLAYKKFFSEKEDASIKDAIQKAKEDTHSFKNNHVVTNLHFGFWTSLFNVYYNNFWISNNRLSGLFIHSKTISLKNVKRDLNKIRKFRNRIAHHEPIWKKCT